MVFLDVSKAFDKVWHEGFIHKLKCIGIGGNLLKWLESYLHNRRQRVVINGQASEWSLTEAGVPQGSILGPLLFLIYINDIIKGIICNIFLFADDTSLMKVIENSIQDFADINRDLSTLADWAHQWLVTFQALKTVYMIFSRKQKKLVHPHLFLEATPLKEGTN